MAQDPKKAQDLVQKTHDMDHQSSDLNKGRPECIRISTIILH